MGNKRKEIELVVDALYKDWTIRKTQMRDIACQWRTTPKQIFEWGWFTATLSCLNRCIIASFKYLESGYDVLLRIDKFFLKEQPIGLHFSLILEKDGVIWSVTPKSLTFNIRKGSLPNVHYDDLLFTIRGQRSAEFRLHNQIRLSSMDYMRTIGEITNIGGWYRYFRIVGASVFKSIPFYLVRLNRTTNKRIIKIYNQKIATKSL